MRLKFSLPKGFTLIELVVVISVLGALLFVSLSFINPIAQLNKADDGRRRTDINQIATALDTYYNDNNCYPSSVPFGEAWIENGVTYMKEVPQSPDCSDDPTSCYILQQSGNCPQWSVVFAKLSKTPQKDACILSTLSGCVPQDFDSTWACETKGNVDCSYLSSINLSDGSPERSGATPGLTPTPTSPPLPTPTPTPINCTPKNYACTGSPARCNVVPAGTGTYCDAACAGAC